MKRRLTITLLILLMVWLLPAHAEAREISTSAAACVIMDARSGRLLLSHNENKALPMASTTKVMTALLAIERGCLTDPVTCSRNAFGVPGTSIYLAQGETLSLEQMLYGLMLQSGNDAAVAIAEHIGGSVEEFCRMMTRRAAELGCSDTVFLTPHGLPCNGHQTTALDLALIAREAMQNDTFRHIVSTRRTTIPWEGRSYDRVLNNKNRLLSTYEGATGVKTGYTRAAGRCLVFGAKRDEMEVIGVVLNCSNWFDEAARLMDTAFAENESVTMLSKGETIREIPVENGNQPCVDVYLASDLSAIVPNGSLPSVEIDLPGAVQAPVLAGQRLGEAKMIWQGELLCASPLIAGSTIPRDDLPARLEHVLRHWLVLGR